MFSKHVIICFKPQLSQILYKEYCRSSRISFSKHMNLPKSGDKKRQMVDYFRLWIEIYWACGRPGLTHLLPWRRQIFYIFLKRILFDIIHLTILLLDWLSYTNMSNSMRLLFHSKKLSCFKMRPSSCLSGYNSISSMKSLMNLFFSRSVILKYILSKLRRAL